MDFNEKIIPILTDPSSQDFKRKGILAHSLPKLNEALGGFEKGELIIITAPPGQGKSQMARTLALDFIKQGLNCLYLSFELRYNQLLGMFIEAGLADMESKLDIFKPEDESEQDIAFVEYLMEKNSVDILVVDDLQSLEEKYSTLRKTDNMSIVMRGLAQRLKNIARNKNIVVITMAHTRKDAIDSKDSSLSELAYSGGMAQVADTVLSIKTDKKDGCAIVEITKARWSGSKVKVKCKNINKRFVEVLYEPTADEVVDSFRRRSQ